MRFMEKSPGKNLIAGKGIDVTHIFNVYNKIPALGGNFIYDIPFAAG